MATITKHVCDRCKEEVADRYEVIGWVSLDIRSISISMGRTKAGSARTAFLGGGERKLDFCRIDCLVHFLDEMVEKQQELYDRNNSEGTP